MWRVTKRKVCGVGKRDDAGACFMQLAKECVLVNSAVKTDYDMHNTAQTQHFDSPWSLSCCPSPASPSLSDLLLCC